MSLPHALAYASACEVKGFVTIETIDYIEKASFRYGLNQEFNVESMIQNNKPAIVYWLNNSLYLNITNQCSNHCWFCFRNYKQGVGSFNLKLAKDPQSDEVISELKMAFSIKRWNEVVFVVSENPLQN